MIHDFEKHAEALRTIGNYRLPYMIFATDAGSESSPAYKQACSMHIAITHITASTFASIDDMLKAIVASGNLLCIVHGTTDDFMPMLYDEAIIAKSELALLPAEFERTYSLSDSLESYIRKPLQIASIRAMQSKHILLNGHKSEAYETLYHIVGTDTCFLAIWDTRFVTAFADLPGYNFAMHEDCNDNSRKFYMTADVYNKLTTSQQTTVSPFIADFITEHASI